LTTEDAIPDEGLRVRALERPSFRLWLVVLLPPATALLNLAFGYVLAHVACARGPKLPIHVFMLACLIIVLVAGVFARRDWVALGENDPGQLSGPVGSRRLMALLGIGGAALSAFFIISQWFPVFVLPPCLRG
jgi:hypothetical protein